MQGCKRLPAQMVHEPKEITNVFSDLLAIPSTILSGWGLMMSRQRTHHLRPIWVASQCTNNGCALLCLLCMVLQLWLLQFLIWIILLLQVLQFESEVEKVDPSPLTTDMLECSLCYRLLHNPVTTPCGHVFCQHCLDRSMDHSLSCPQCRGSLSEVRQIKTLSAVITSIQIWLSYSILVRKAATQKL